jgi:hypothetical protein
MDSSEAKRLKQLEEENRTLKHVVTEFTSDDRALNKQGGFLLQCSDHQTSLSVPDLILAFGAKLRMILAKERGTVYVEEPFHA